MSRFIGQEVFKTIVEMAYEMEYHVRAEEEFNVARDELITLLDKVKKSNRNTRVLRRINGKTTKWSCFDSELWMAKGKKHHHQLFIDYKRYVDSQGKVRERETFTLDVTGCGWIGRKTRMIMDHEEKRPFDEMKEILAMNYLAGFAYYFWSR